LRCRARLWYINMHTLKINIGVYISPLRESIISPQIAMKFCTLIILIYVINLVKFDVDWSQDWWAVKCKSFVFTSEVVLKTALCCCACCDQFKPVLINKLRFHVIFNSQISNTMCSRLQMSFQHRDVVEKLYSI